ncbi:hypothetical protein Droror1_Dr00010470 [Drosera rotundifolia]
MGQISPPETVFSAGDDKLRQSINLISSLISESHTIRVFTSKWGAIRVKLDELNSMLIFTQDCDLRADNETLLDLVSTLMITVSDCRDLAGRCIRVSYSGKLLMQSELDKVCVKLDAHLRDLSGFYAAGVSSSAIVVSRPGPGASRDDMRFYVMDLCTRLRIGSVEIKKMALVSLNEVVVEDEKYVRLVVEMNDMLILLVDCLELLEPDLQEEAAQLVGVIVGFDAFKVLLIGVGIIAPLVRVLESQSFRAKGFAFECLMKLTENGDNAWSLSAHGGVTALLDVCSNGDPMDGLVGPACRVLRNLVCVEEIKRFMIEEGVISTFITLVRSRDELTQITSIDFLQRIASGDEPIGHMIVRQGGIRELVRMFDPQSSSSSYKSRERALKAIETICFSSPDCFNLLVNYGFMDQLLYFIRRGDTSIQELSLKAASRLIGTSDEAKKIMGDAGFIPEFVKFLEAKSFEVREMAAEAISSMVIVPKNRKKFLQEDKNIGIILHLIDPNEVNSGNLKFLLSTLLSISTCKSARKRIIDSGCMKNIEKLAENGACDAKKIIRNISTNKFHAMLNKILHS